MINLNGCKKTLLIGLLTIAGALSVSGINARAEGDFEQEAQRLYQMADIFDAEMDEPYRIRQDLVERAEQSGGEFSKAASRFENLAMAFNDRECRRLFMQDLESYWRRVNDLCVRRKQILTPVVESVNMNAERMSWPICLYDLLDRDELCRWLRRLDIFDIPEELLDRAWQEMRNAEPAYREWQAEARQLREEMIVFFDTVFFLRFGPMSIKDDDNHFTAGYRGNKGNTGFFTEGMDWVKAIKEAIIMNWCESIKEELQRLPEYKFREGKRCYELKVSCAMESIEKARAAGDTKGVEENEKFLEYFLEYAALYKEALIRRRACYDRWGEMVNYISELEEWYARTNVRSLIDRAVGRDAIHAFREYLMLDSYYGETEYRLLQTKKAFGYPV